MMDGVHDLGGKQGFGPIPIGDDSVAFKHEWEKRMWALARSGIAHGITIDWFRHGLERMVPTDYLSFPYFNKWCANYMMLMIDGGAITAQEAVTGHIAKPAAPAAPKTLQDVLAANSTANIDFEMETTQPTGFKIGDTIKTKRLIAADHTRLPAYARNATGTIIAHHGTHPLPDKGALGLHEGEHLYTVSFDATELWGEEANPRDTVTLELWESYFVHP